MNNTTNNTTDITQKFQECMDLLKNGKKIVWNQRYVYGQVPMITLLGRNPSQTDSFELDCISKNTFEKYCVETQITDVDEVHVVGYSSRDSSLILYVFANPQMNRTFAQLENGDCVDFKLGLIDFWSAYGGEYAEPIKRTVQLTMFKRYDEHYSRKYYTDEIMEVPDDIIEMWELSEWLKETYKPYKGMDISVNTDNFPNGYPLYIPAESRKEQ